MKLFQYFHIQMVVLGNNPSAVMVFQRFIFSGKKCWLVYIWHYRIKLFLRHLPNCPCSNFSQYVDRFQEISPRIAKQLRLNFFLNSYLPSNYFNVSIFRWSLCHLYEIIRLLLCFFSGLYFPPKHYGKNIRSASGFFIAN
jgi:hypothetical protein